MVSKRVTLNKGLNTKAAGNFVRVADESGSEIVLERGGSRVNAKSLLGVLSITVDEGPELIIEVSGPDEEKVAESLYALISES